MEVTKEMLNQALAQRIGKETFEKLSQSAVAVVGLGGLGSHIAVMLARSGVGKLFLVDFDTVDITNLNRQAYRISDIGRPKTEALQGILREINPYIEVATAHCKVNEKNAAALFGSYSIVCEAFDVAEEKAMLVNTLLEQCPNTTVISGVGMAGSGSSNDITTKRVMRRLYLCGDGKSDVAQGLGLTAPRVTVCAGHQGNMAVRLILGEEES
ncbi:MAG: sulfur carrier protein ThiS adenylyltransferase ThiF [Bacillota bacterium]|nr:sulfur carrier protein ThiS adenylyltransferase ThiF [Bacillota bacterium]